MDNTEDGDSVKRWQICLFDLVAWIKRMLVNEASIKRVVYTVAFNQTTEKVS